MTSTFSVHRLDDDDDPGGEDGGSVLVRVTGDVDLVCGFEAPVLLAGLAARRPCRIVIDTSDVTFLDVAGLSVLLVLAARTSAAGHRVCLRRPSPPVVRVLALTGTADLLPLDDGDGGGSDGGDRCHRDDGPEWSALRRSLVFRHVERLVHDGTSWDDPSAGPLANLRRRRAITADPA